MSNERISIELVELLGQDPGVPTIWSRLSRLGAQLGLKADLLQQVRTQPSTRASLRRNLLEALWLRRSEVLPETDRWRPSPYLARLLRSASLPLSGPTREQRLRAYLSIPDLLLGIESEIYLKGRPLMAKAFGAIATSSDQDWLAVAQQKLSRGQSWSDSEAQQLQAYVGAPTADTPGLVRYLVTHIEYLDSGLELLGSAEEALEVKQITTARLGTLDQQRDLVGRHLLSLARGQEAQSLLKLFYRELLWVGRVEHFQELAPSRLLIEEGLLSGLISDCLRYGRVEVLRYCLGLAIEEGSSISLEGLRSAVERHDLTTVSVMAAALKRQPQLWFSSPDLSTQWQEALDTATSMGFSDIVRLMDISRMSRRLSPPSRLPLEVASSSAEPRLVAVTGYNDDEDRGSQEITMEDMMEYEF